MSSLARYLIAVLLLGCDAEIRKEAAGGGGPGASGGETSSDSGSGGAPGEGGAPPVAPPCLALELTGEPTVVTTVGRARTGLSLSHAGEVVAARGVGTGYDPLTRLSWLDAWGTWPPPLMAEREIEDAVLLVPGSLAGVTALQLNAPASPGDMQLALNLTADNAPPSITFPQGETGVAVGRRGAGYVAVTEQEDDDAADLILRAYDEDGSALFESTVPMCLPGAVLPAAPSLLSVDSSSTLLAVPTAEPPESCIYPQTLLWVRTMGADGEGLANLIDVDAERILSSVDLVGGTSGPLLVYGRYDENGPASSQYVQLYKVGLDANAAPTSAIEPLEPTGSLPLDKPAVVALPGGGFVVAIFARVQPGEEQVWVGLHDGNGMLMQELTFAQPSPLNRAGVHGVAAPDGGGVVLAWTRQTGDGDLDNEQVMMRLACVDP